jgi:tetratricopeptide (TPR) repeat protein
MRNALLAALLFSACAHTAARDGLVEAKAAIMAADYRADLTALRTQRDRLVAMQVAPDVAYLASYWRGYANWRIALNGVSRKMAPADVETYLQSAAADFDESVKLKPDFADAYAAGASVNGWLTQFHRDDPTALKLGFQKSASMLQRALELDPHNPRVLWVQAGDLLFKPPQFGGDKARAIDIYKEAIAAADAQHVTDPSLPDWGKAEALMALAFAQKESDPVAARRYADDALRLAPEWWYVREVLGRQITDAMSK